MSVTPDFIGQVYKDTNTGNLWRANSTTPGDWTLEVQDMKLKWLLRTAKFYEQFVFATYADLPGITQLQFDSQVYAGFDIESTTQLVSFSCPNMTDCDGVDVQGFGLTFKSNTALTTISAPLLQTIAYIAINGNDLLSSLVLTSLQASDDSIAIKNCPALTSLNLSALQTIDNAGSIDCSFNTALTTIDISSFVPSDGSEFTAEGSSLNAASVNHVLARYVANPAYVSGLVTLAAGLNAAPTGQGILDAATLTGRGVTVTTN